MADLEVRHGDLYAATEGRAFWALDDLSALRQMSADVSKDAVHLFTPRSALLGGGPSPATTTAGRNTPAGANVYYALASVPDSATAMKIEFLDGAGKVLQSYARSSGSAPAAGPPGFGGAPPRPRLEPKVGLNAFQWDLRAEPPTTLPGGIAMFGGPTNGYLVGPGRYQVRLTVGSTVVTQPLEVRLDPRVTISPAEVAARDSMTRAINARVGEIHDALIRIRDVKDQVTRFVDHAKDAPNATAISAQGKTIGEKVDTLGPKLSTKAANGQDIINFRNGINAQYVFLLGNVEGNDVLTQPVRDRFAELERLWGALRSQVDVLEQQDVPAFNKLLQEGKVEGVIVPKPKPKVVM